MLQPIQAMMLFILCCLNFALPQVSHAQEGMASYYGSYHHGRKTASGERFNMHGLSAAHRTLPLGTVIRVTDLDTLNSTVVTVNDRGPYHGNRILDLSQGAAKKLGMIKQGVSRVNIDVLKLPDKPDRMGLLLRSLEKKQK